MAPIFIFLALLRLFPVRGETISTHLLCRHGSRAPYSSIPSDTEHAALFDNIGQQLSIQGINESYNQGAFFRNFYKDMVKYFPESLKVTSSSKDRVIQSTEAFIAGLYVPPLKKRFREDLAWVPLPLEVFSKDDYYLYGVTADDCPALYNSVADVYDSEEFQNVMKSFADEMKVICKLAGYDQQFNEKLMLYCVYRLADYISSSLVEHLPIAGWISYDVQNIILQCKLRLNEIFYSNKKLAFLAKGGGPYLGIVMKAIRRAVREPRKRSVYVYGAHGSTLSAFYGNLGQPIRHADFGECAVIELHLINEEFYIDMFIKSADSKFVKHINLPNCSVRCPLERFIELIQHRVNQDPVKQCRTENVESDPNGIRHLLMQMTGLDEQKEVFINEV